MEDAPCRSTAPTPWFGLIDLASCPVLVNKRRRRPGLEKVQDGLFQQSARLSSLNNHQQNEIDRHDARSARDEIPRRTPFLATPVLQPAGAGLASWRFRIIIYRGSDRKS